MSEIIEMPYGTGKSFEQQFIALFIEAYNEIFTADPGADFLSRERLPQ